MSFSSASFGVRPHGQRQPVHDRRGARHRQRPGGGERGPPEPDPQCRAGGPLAGPAGRPAERRGRALRPRGGQHPGGCDHRPAAPRAGGAGPGGHLHLLGHPPEPAGGGGGPGPVLGV